MFWGRDPRSRQAHIPANRLQGQERAFREVPGEVVGWRDGSAVLTGEEGCGRERVSCLEDWGRGGVQILYMRRCAVRNVPGGDSYEGD